MKKIKFLMFSLFAIQMMCASYAKRAQKHHLPYSKIACIPDPVVCQICKKMNNNKPCCSDPVAHTVIETARIFYPCYK